MGELRAGGITWGRECSSEAARRNGDASAWPWQPTSAPTHSVGHSRCFWWLIICDVIWTIPCTVTPNSKVLPPLRGNWPGGLGMESWKRRKRKVKKKMDEDVVRLKQLVFFFFTLVALKVLCNLEFVFHLTLKIKKKTKNKKRSHWLSLHELYNLFIRNNIGGLLSTFHRWGTGSWEVKSLWPSGARICNS